jgi:hypothetical protein
MVAEGGVPFDGRRLGAGDVHARRHSATKTVTCTGMEPVEPARATTRHAKGAAEKNGLVKDDGQRQTRATIRSEICAGPQDPIEMDEKPRALAAELTSGDHGRARARPP